MTKHKEGGWFRARSYNHLDYPLSFEAAKKLVEDPKRVSNRQFLPLIGYTDKKRRYKTDNTDRSIPRRLRPKIVSTKEREIRYASHGDAAVYQFYNHKISDLYESFLISHFLDDSVIGYRSGKGSNIDMAADAFCEIASKGSVTALCFDVENFFPSIRHVDLRNGLEYLLGGHPLPQDWYRVFRSITRYSWVEIVELAQLEGFDPKDPPFPLVQNINEALDRCRAAKFVHKHKAIEGIPQGTPISATAANIAMMAFDRAVHAYVSEIAGTYRRYSDDIMLLVPPENEYSAQEFMNSLAASHGLTISVSKTEISRFRVIGGVQTADNPISYLGFCFDGTKTFLRPSTLSRYYRRMTYAVRGAVRGAGKKGRPATDTFKRGLFTEFTHLGKRNFYSYSRRAHAKLPNSIVKRQLRRHFRVLLRKLVSKGR